LKETENVESLEQTDGDMSLNDEEIGTDRRKFLRRASEKPLVETEGGKSLEQAATGDMALYDEVTSTDCRKSLRRASEKLLKQTENGKSLEQATGDMALNDEVTSTDRRKSLRRASEKPWKETENGKSLEQATGDMALNDEEDSTDRRKSLIRRLSRKFSIRQIVQRSMRHPRDMDICYGSESGHPGTVVFLQVVSKCATENSKKGWTPLVYKSIRCQLQGRRFFIRNDRDSPWREASAEERVEHTRRTFDTKRPELKRRRLRNERTNALAS
jgi:hypothetical protein